MPKEASTKVSSTEAPKSPSKTAKKKSPYQEFMATEIKKVKAENPGMEHKAAFKMAAGNWKSSPNNPKNKVEE
ncbi:hypothetical protein BKA69DRAFT_1124402 [Paraphysoderma sedebokerense]|nr:hypothetical protein BKA69DRAFT_1124402 [Paraphysoderma sedebokerense]